MSKNLMRPAFARLPDAAHDMAQFVVDNPAQSVVVVSGTIVLTRLLANLVRPRGPVEALALVVVIEALAMGGAAAMIKNGWMPFKVRDADGNLVTMIAGKVSDAAEAAAPQP